MDIQNFRINARLYGILCIPKKEGKYPALLTVPGAGVRAYSGNIAMAEKGLDHPGDWHSWDPGDDGMTVFIMTWAQEH